MRGEQSVDAALLTVVLALFTASAFGLTELPGGATSWEPREWKGVHDAAKALILPLLALRLGLALSGRENADLTLRNRVWAAMALCWVGDIALTFSGDTAFLIGLVSFLLGHVMFIMAYRHMFVSGWGQSRGLFHGIAGGLLFVVAATVALTLTAKAHAFLRGRGFVTPQDVKSVAQDVLRHRVSVTFEAEAEEKTSETIIQKILDELPVP